MPLDWGGADVVVPGTGSKTEGSTPPPPTFEVGRPGKVPGIFGLSFLASAAALKTTLIVIGKI